MNTLPVRSLARSQIETLATLFRKSGRVDGNGGGSAGSLDVVGTQPVSLTDIELKQDEIRARSKPQVCWELAVTCSIEALGAQAEGEGTRPVMSAEEMMNLGRPIGSPEEDVPLVDFFEPARFVWSEEDYLASCAAKRFSEKTDADY